MIPAARLCLRRCGRYYTPMPGSSPSPRTTARNAAPLRGRDWLGARTLLAWRRSQRFVRVWVLVLGPLAALAAILAATRREPGSAERAQTARLIADTVRTRAAVDRLAAAALAADSQRAAAVRALAAAPARPSAAPAAVPAPLVNPTLAAFDAAIREARRLRTPTAWLGVAEQPPVSGGPRMRALADSLSRLTRERDLLPSGPDRDQLAAPLTATINRIGYTIVAIAENRRNELMARVGLTLDVVTRPAGPATAGGDERASSAPDTAAHAARARLQADSLDAARRAHAAARAAVAAAAPLDADAGGDGVPASVVALLSLLVGGVAGRVGLALSREMRVPAVAHAREAEGLTGIPVLLTVNDDAPLGPARFRPLGVDPFRMLYLGLTSSGTRARTVVVTGDDPVITGAVGARFTISAAADHRTVLAVDVDPEQIVLSRIFRERAEPGLSDAIAGAFAWREVARPIGSSDGLPITLLPAGTERDERTDPARLAEARAGLARFRGSFDLTVVVAPLAQLDVAMQLVEGAPVVLSATIGTTPLPRLEADGATLRASGHRIHGAVLWDSGRPALPSRAELAALLSKQRGRTPGGSFAAVRKALGED